MEQKMSLESTDLTSTASWFPLVGLYTALGLLACLILLIRDLYHAYRRGKLHIPSEFFSLNSFTLALLAVSMKITLHLTPAVPGIINQLSKLTGGVLVTILMGFIVPSLADLEGSALLRNMGGMTILVITVIFNVNIQIRTGVIFSFYVVEHIIVLIMMLLMLLAMWYVTFIKDWVTGFLADSWRKKTRGIQGPVGSKVLEELSSELGPQFAVCRYTNFVVFVRLLSTFSLLTLFEAFLGSYHVNPREFLIGVSSCTWSLWVVVTLQIITVAVAFIAILVRSSYIIFSNFSAPYDREATKTLDKLTSANFFLSVISFEEIARSTSSQGIDYIPLTYSESWFVKRIQDVWEFLEKLFIIFFYVLYLLIGGTDYVGKKLCCRHSNVDSRSRNQSEYLQLSGDECEKDKPENLIQLFEATKPYKEFSSLDKESTTSLLAVVLVRLTSIMVPRDDSLEKSFAEVFNILQFMEKSSAIYTKKKLAKELWMTRDSKKHWFERDVICPLQEAFPQMNMIMQEGGISFMEKFLSLVTENASLNRVIRSAALSAIVNEYMQEVPPPPINKVIQQLFVQILRSLLPQSHEAITSYVLQSPVADREERIRTGYKLVYKYEMVSEYCKYELVQPDEDSSSSANPSTDEAEPNVRVQSDEASSSSIHRYPDYEAAWRAVGQVRKFTSE